MWSAWSTGASATLAFRLSEREQAACRPRPTPAAVLPPGVADVLAVLRSSGVVLDGDDDVIRASPAAYILGLVRGERLRAPTTCSSWPARCAGTARSARPTWSCRAARCSPSGCRSGCGSRRWGRAWCSLLVEDRTEARRVDAVRRDFLANVSHELKTPVGGLALLAEAMVDAADDPEAVRRFAGRMQHESDRLSRLVQDVIELSRLQGHDPFEKPTLVSLDDVVVEAVDRSRVRAETRVHQPGLRRR